MLFLGALCFVCGFAAYLPQAYGQVGPVTTLTPSTTPVTPTTPAFDPCQNVSHTSLSSADRFLGNTNQQSVKCDRRDLSLGWYRFTGGAGDRLAESCPPTRRCGTHAPGWLNGAHPTQAEGVVTREVCYHWSGSCCRWRNNIKVKNCGAFYVYQFQKPPACSLRYCGEASECKTYRALDQADRAVGNRDQSNVKCDGRAPDNIVSPAWYRMTGASGDKIPNKCIPKNRCGTHAPGWLNGSHPAVLEGVVSRQVCYHWFRGCCSWKNNIKIRNCGSYYVYELIKPPVCYLRYCGNKEGPVTTLTPSTTPVTPTTPGCGAVVNDTLKSPGYPNYYPSDVHCVYRVHIPHGMAMNINFSDFHVEGHPSCWYDYLKIENDNGQFFGKYCGQRSGVNVVVTGHTAVITFYSDSSWQERGYQLVFSYFPVATLSPSATPSTNASSSTAPPTVKPTGCPTAGPGSDPQSRLKYFIALLRLLLNQMEQIVDNDLGCNSSVNKREHIERVEKTIHNVDAAMKSAGRHKRDVIQTMMVDQLKKKAADLMSKLKTKQQDATMKSAGRQKRDVSDAMMVDQLKKKAANLMTNVKDKQGQYKRKIQLKAREKKRVAKERPLMKNTAENIAEKLFNMEKEKL